MSHTIDVAKKKNDGALMQAERTEMGRLLLLAVVFGPARGALSVRLAVSQLRLLVLVRRERLQSHAICEKKT